MSSSPGLRQRSKVRNVGAQNVKDKFRGVRISVKSQEGQGLAASYNAIAYPWDMAGGVIGVIYAEHLLQRQPVTVQLRGNRNNVQDIQFSPHYDDLLASASDDTSVRLWRVPLAPPEEPMSIDENCELKGHERRVLNLSWHPLAEGIIASGGQDGVVHVWDIKSESTAFTCEAGELVHHLGWNGSGTSLCVASKDKKFHVFDPRAGAQPQMSINGHAGVKGAKLTWLGGVRPEEQIFTAGFQKGPGRELWLLDTRKFDAPIWEGETSRGSATLVPVYDPDLGILCLPGKGEGGCAMYDLSLADTQDNVGSYRSTEPSRGFCFVPKRSVNTLEREVLRMYKAEGQGNNCAIQPVTFTIPRRNTEFQEDLFPPTYDCVPKLTAEQWRQGITSDSSSVDRVSLNPVDEQVHPLQSPRDILSVSLQAGAKSRTVTPTPSVCRTPEETAAVDAEVQKLRAEISTLKLQLSDALNAKDAAKKKAEEFRTETEEVRAMFAHCHRAMVSAAATVIAKQQKKMAAAAAATS